MDSPNYSNIIVNKLNCVILWLYFKKNPFNLVPPKEVDFWADRTKPRIEIERLAKTFPKNPSNQIRAIWGLWGNGKSHALG